MWAPPAIHWQRMTRGAARRHTKCSPSLLLELDRAISQVSEPRKPGFRAWWLVTHMEKKHPGFWLLYFILSNKIYTVCMRICASTPASPLPSHSADGWDIHRSVPAPMLQLHFHCRYVLVAWSPASRQDALQLNLCFPGPSRTLKDTQLQNCFI